VRLRTFENLAKTARNIQENIMLGRPAPNEAAEYYSRYIDRVQGEDVVAEFSSQLDEALALFSSISEEQSLHRYAADKWSIRELLGHVNDCERVFTFRALWFARGFTDELPSFDQEVAFKFANSDNIPWATHVEEFKDLRAATVKFFRNLPDDAWMRSGVASGSPVTVRALAYVIAGHVTHHLAILRERYL
jgi:hypothetical protein